MTAPNFGGNYTALKNPDEKNIGFSRSNDDQLRFKETAQDDFDIQNYKLPEVDYSNREKTFGLFRHLCQIYDHSVLFVIMFNYFNNGASSMVLMVIVNMYQENYFISPLYAQLHVAVIGFPVIFAFLFGLISDSVPIMGSRKRSYLIIMSLLQISTCVTFIMVADTSVNVATGMLAMNSLAMTWLDVIVDGMIVVEQRKDPVHGSADLQVFSYICLAMGGVIPNALAIPLSLKYGLSLCFVVPAFIGCLILGAAIALSASSTHEKQQILDMRFTERLRFNWRAIKQAVKIKPLMNTLIFYGAYVVLSPSYKDFLDYFYNFDPDLDACIEIIVFISVLIVAIIYSEYLEEFPMRSLVRFGIGMLFLNSVFNILLVMNITFGLSKFGFVCLQTLLFDASYQAFLYMPAYVSVAQMIPENIETSVFAILKSFEGLQVLVWGRILGSILYYFSSPEGVQFDLAIGEGVTAGIALVMIFFAQILPRAEEIEAVQRTIFWHTIKCEEQFDRTRIDLNIEAKLGQFRLAESEVELTDEGNNFSQILPTDSYAIKQRSYINRKSAL